MKRNISLLLSIIFVFLVCSCQRKDILLFLNWGEYIDEDMISCFEKEYNVNVMMDLADSNEKFYSKVRGGTTVYDVVSPSDYMVMKMYQNDMLAKLDFSKITNYSLDNRLPGVCGISKTMESYYSGITDYYVPYLWGTWGIMYSTKKEGLEAAIINSDNQWSALFDKSSLPSGTKVAMYNSYLHDYYAACKYLGFDSTKPLDDASLKILLNTVKNASFDAWGTDNIKKDIVVGNIDVGFMWTGDFLYYYCEEAAKRVIDAYTNGDILEEEIPKMLEILTSNDRIYSVDGKDYQIGFDIFIPDDTIAFCDNLVITKNARHYDLAIEFINFMCSRNFGIEKNDVAYKNAYYVSYNTPFIDVYEDLVDLKNNSFDNIGTIYNEEVKNGVNSYDTTLYWNAYDRAIGIAFDKYYPKEVEIILDDGSIKNYKGDILANFQRSYVNIINRTFDNAKA